MGLIRFTAALVLLAIFSAPISAKELVISKVSGDKELLILSILQLAVKKSGENLTIKELAQEVPIARRENETASGSLDLMWAGSSPKLDNKLRAVRIPLLKGMLGHRIFIIRQGDQASFNSVYNLSDLKQLKAGMGRTWGSTKVLEAAGLNVVSTLKYKNLFYMLEGGRFDYFPRAVHEPWSEVSNHPDLPLEVENNILLIYPYAMYFYIAKSNDELHATLTRGLEAAIADGSFNQLFYSHPMVKSAVEKTQFNQRVVLRISNPSMHPDTPVDRPELWLDVENL